MPRSGAALVHGPGCGAARAGARTTTGGGGNLRRFILLIATDPACSVGSGGCCVTACTLSSQTTRSAGERRSRSYHTSIRPVLFIVVAIAGLAFGEDAARGAIASQLSELMGRASADLVQTALQSASGKSSGILASVVGATTLLIAASGVFGEMQSALNAIRKAQPQGTTVSRSATGARGEPWPRRGARLPAAGLPGDQRHPVRA